MVESGAGRYTQLTQVGRHELIADEPVSVGGGNAGPAPYDSRLPALGSSTSMTLRVVAKRKNWQLEPVEVTLKQRHVHAQDCADCASTDDQVLEIARRIRLRGSIDSAVAGHHRALGGEMTCPSELSLVMACWKNGVTLTSRREGTRHDC